MSAGGWRAPARAVWLLLGCGVDGAGPATTAIDGDGLGSSTLAGTESGEEEPAGSTAGDDGVPGRPAVPPAEPEDPRRPAIEPAFEDLTEALSLHAPHEIVLGHFGAGVAWGDVDGDGWLDLLMTGGAGPSTLLRNEGDGSFSVSPLSADLAAIADSTGATFVDLDDDGWLDLYVVCRGPNVLLHNDHGRALVDVTAAAGVGDPGHGATASWADWDRDGDLDLFVANTSLQLDALYRNEGDGVFTDVRHLLPALGLRQSFAGAFTDIDDDGDLDLYVVVDKYAGNQLWRNDGEGCEGWCFSEVSVALGADTALDAMGISVGDVDGDGDLDLAYSDHGGQALLLSQWAQGQEGYALRLHEAAGLGLPTTQPSWGIAFVDYDGDGDLDLYAAASGHLGPLVGNPLYRNRGDGSFEAASFRSGADDPGQGFGLAVADYDHDGAIDLAVGNRNEGLRLLHNRRPWPAGYHHTTLELQGAGVGGRQAVGARVWLETSGGRTLVREVAIGTSLGAGSSTRLLFNLGPETIERVTVRWPDGIVEEVGGAALDGRWVHAHPARALDGRKGRGSVPSVVDSRAR